MFTSLLVGLDGSLQSLIALTQAILVGRRFRSQIILVHVAREESLAGLRPQWMGPGSDQGTSSEDHSARALLEGAAETVRQAGLTVRTELRRGDVVETLRELAADVGAIVVGRSGVLGGGDPLGPDTRELIRRCPRPVLVCGSAPSPMNRCLVAYDGQPASEAALSFAARYAEIAEAHLDVLHVADDSAGGPCRARPDLRRVLRLALQLRDSPGHGEGGGGRGGSDRGVPLQRALHRHQSRGGAPVGTLPHGGYLAGHRYPRPGPQ